MGKFHRFLALFWGVDFKRSVKAWIYTEEVYYRFGVEILGVWFELKNDFRACVTAVVDGIHMGHWLALQSPRSLFNLSKSASSLKPRMQVYREILRNFKLLKSMDLRDRNHCMTLVDQSHLVVSLAFVVVWDFTKIISADLNLIHLRECFLLPLYQTIQVGF